jgi:hypothetical protein
MTSVPKVVEVDSVRDVVGANSDDDDDDVGRQTQKPRIPKEVEWKCKLLVAFFNPNCADSADALRHETLLGDVEKWEEEAKRWTQIPDLDDSYTRDQERLLISLRFKYPAQKNQYWAIVDRAKQNGWSVLASAELERVYAYYVNTLQAQTKFSACEKRSKSCTERCKMITVLAIGAIMILLSLAVLGCTFWLRTTPSALVFTSHLHQNFVNNQTVPTITASQASVFALSSVIEIGVFGSACMSFYQYGVFEEWISSDYLALFAGLELSQGVGTFISIGTLTNVNKDSKEISDESYTALFTTYILIIIQSIISACISGLVAYFKQVEKKNS